MKRYNLSEIMKGAHNMYRTGKYSTFADALRKSWKVAKFNKEIADRRAETIAYHEAIGVRVTLRASNIHFIKL